jgi:hypothetical protein
VPPAAVKVAVPSHPGTQVGFIVLEIFIINPGGGCIRQDVVVAVHPFASSTVIV